MIPEIYWSRTSAAVTSELSQAWEEQGPGTVG